MIKRLSLASALLAVVAAGGCTVHQTTAPSLSGPSDFGVSIAISASPDAINQDGGSQSSIRVIARDSNGRAIVGETFRLDVLVNGSQVDYGTLSARTLVTGADGAASAIYTAPPASPSGVTTASCATINMPGALVGQCVTILATPLTGPGTANDFSAAQSQSVQIHLMPVGLIVPTVQATPQFTVTPAGPAANAPAVFDASTSCAGPLNAAGACPAGSGTITLYQWNFGDGSTGTGAQTTHTYATAQTYSVSLTITTDTGGTATTTKAITVGASTTAPTAAFVISPTAPSAGRAVFFNADASRAGAGHTLTQFNWNFGDVASSSNTASGFQVQHTFQYAGTYTVVLTIADDAGQRTTISQTVAVSAASVTADLVLTQVGLNVHADAGASTPSPGASITSYTFAVVGGSTFTVTPPTTTKDIALGSGTWTITLTVQDSANIVGTTTRTITIP